MKQELRTILQQAVAAALKVLEHDAAKIPEIQLEVPRNPEHGDFSTNIALVLAKPLGLVPRELAAAIVAQLRSDPLIEGCETAGPGFINLHVSTAAFMRVIGEVLEQAGAYGRFDSGAGKRIQIEYVSANPTGPLHVGHGRGAAYGAVLANILEAAGYEVSREYYVNDAGRQMDILAMSVYLRYLESAGIGIEFPANGYQGGYIKDMSEQLRADQGDRYVRSLAAVAASDPEILLDKLIENVKTVLGGEDYAEIHRFARDQILDGIKHDLSVFGVEFDNWFPESSLMDKGEIQAAVTALNDSGHVYVKDGARWFKSTAFGDEKDRVVVRDNGSPTYFASDIAYHADKYRRGFDHLINIWGADHHGYICRVKAAIEAMGLPPDRLEVLLVQFAALFRGGQKLAMSTRSGEFVTLSELVEEVGSDAARFFYITRRSDQHLDFDLDLAKSQSNENPVYYVQYAHARICQLIRESKEKSYELDTALGIACSGQLVDAREKQLAAQLSRYGEVLETAVHNREPHLITNYLRELAADFHGFYHGCRVVIDDAEMRNARLALSLAVKQVLSNGLELLGVSAPEAM